MWFAVSFLVVLVLLAVFAELIPGLAAPDKAWGEFHEPPSLSFNGLLGTDTLGRSTMSRAIYGARVSLTIAVVSSVISLTLGITLGLLAGFYRGKWERVVDLYANSIAAMPPLLLVLALIAATGASAGDDHARPRVHDERDVRPRHEGRGHLRTPAATTCWPPGHWVPATAGSCSVRSCPTSCPP